MVVAARAAAPSCVALALVLAACGSPAPAPSPAVDGAPVVLAAPPPVADPTTAYVGAAACAECHAAASTAWARSPHGRHGQFLARPDEAADLAVGVVWMQAYMRRDDTGLERIVSRCRDLRDGSWRDVPQVLAEIGGRWTEPDAASPPPMAVPTERRSFESDCAGCHSSQPTLALGRESRLAGSTMAASLDCEACHGPGREHATAWHGLRGDRPYARLSRLSARAQVAACGRCHGGPATDAGFDPAVDGDRFVTSLLDRRGFLVDGRAAGQVYQAPPFVGSPCFRKGGLVCTDCHAPHEGGLVGAGTAGDGLCVRCHAGFASRSHTHHEPSGAGARCVECHMPRLLTGLVAHQRDHRISVPLPSIVQTPDACTACHKGRSKAWAREAWRERWGEPSAQRLATVAAVAALADARIGRPDATALTAALSHRDPFVRLNAARALGDPTALLHDEVPEVRAGLAEVAPAGARGDDALAVLMTDVEPRVRAAAAVALAARGSAAADQVPDADLALAARHFHDDPWSRLTLAERERRRGRAAGAAAWSFAAFLARPFSPETAITAAADLLHAGDVERARGVLVAARRLAGSDAVRRRLDEVAAQVEHAAARRARKSP